MKKNIQLIICLTIIGCSDGNYTNNIEQKKDISYKDEQNSHVDLECGNSDCVPRSLTLPYHKKTISERKKIAGIDLKTLMKDLASEKLISQVDYNNINFDDKSNPVFFDSGNAILVVNPDDDSNDIKSLEYMYKNCFSISSGDKEKIEYILDLFKFKGNKENLYAFQKRGNDIIVNTNKNGSIVFEIACDPINSSGQLNIYHQ